jgi:DNA-binding transcriptional ArsR family regulator
MSDEWDAVGFVISSEYRIAVLGRLASGPATPSRIADDTGLAITHVSRALQSLRDQSLVELLVPEQRKKGRIYGATDRGIEIWELIQAKDLLD